MRNMAMQPNARQGDALRMAKQGDATECETGPCTRMRGGTTSLAAKPAMPLHANRGDAVEYDARRCAGRERWAMQLNAEQGGASGREAG
jgi:hypothetical protein